MVFGVPECDYVPAVGMFRVRKAIGKSFSSGGFGMMLSVGDSSSPETTPQGNNEREEDDAEQTNVGATSMETTPSMSKPSPAEHLFIEEALVLFERGVLDVYDCDGTKLDARRLYGMLESLDVPLPIYLTYAHLRAQDYRVLRHVSLPEIMSVFDAERQDGSTYEMIKQARRTSPPITLDDNPAAIALDVYQPNTQFRKTNPGTPDLYVSVASYKLPSPTFTELQGIMEQCNDVPLRIATVSDSGVVVMFGVTNVGVPDISNNESDNHDDCDS